MITSRTGPSTGALPTTLIKKEESGKRKKRPGGKKRDTGGTNRCKKNVKRTKHHREARVILPFGEIKRNSRGKRLWGGSFGQNKEMARGFGTRRAGGYEIMRRPRKSAAGKLGKKRPAKETNQRVIPQGKSEPQNGEEGRDDSQRTLRKVGRGERRLLNKRGDSQKA